jgi:V8-like Glu-specific endopeptidase
LAACSALLLAALILPPWAGAADRAISVREVDRTAADAYWTAARMRTAIPLEAPPPSGEHSAGSRAPGRDRPLVVPSVRAAAASLDRDWIEDPSAQPFRAHGRVFFTLGGEDFACSGTSVASSNSSVVLTAGHCVFDRGGPVSNWAFVPAYEDGAAPFGVWNAEQLATPAKWRRKANLSYDIGAVVVAVDERGRSLTDVVGGRGIAFNQKRRKTYQSFGYPAIPSPTAPEFDGEREYRCTSKLAGNDDPPGRGPNTLFIPCDMTGGSSGGGWVSGGVLLSVNSYSYCEDDLGLICDGRLYGPYLDGTAKALYSAVSGEPQFCEGRQVTVLGTGGADRLVGSSGPDVFQGLGGADQIIGKAGNDVACGGGGRDELKGNGGRDELFGNNGNDRLHGGGGRDACYGGAGRDRARGCETRTGV